MTAYFFVHNAPLKQLASIIKRTGRKVAVMDKAIRLIQDQQNEIRLLKEMQKKMLFNVDDSTLGKMVADLFH